MKNIIKQIPYLIVITLTFYLFPFIVKDTTTAMLLMLIVFPLICLITSFIYGLRQQFSWSYSIIVTILFLPTLLIFYNYTAWVYIMIYGIISLMGNLIGSKLKK